MIDDTGFPKDGTVAVCGPAVLRHAGQDRQLPDRGERAVVTDTASAASNWRLFCPKSWDDTTITDAGRPPRRSDAAPGAVRIPDEVRHREKWRLALDMLDEMTEDWGLPTLPVTADAGYGDTTGSGSAWPNAACPTWSQVKAHRHRPPRRRRPDHPALHRPGPPARPRYPDDPVNLASSPWPPAAAALRQVTWRHGTRHERPRTRPRRCAHSSWPAGPPGQPRHPPRHRRQPARVLADRRMATRRTPNPPSTGCPTCPPTPH